METIRNKGGKGGKRRAPEVALKIADDDDDDESEEEEEEEEN